MWTEEYQAELIESLALVNFKGVFTRDRQPKLAARRLRELWRA